MSKGRTNGNEFLGSQRISALQSTDSMERVSQPGWGLSAKQWVPFPAWAHWFWYHPWWPVKLLRQWEWQEEVSDLQRHLRVLSATDADAQCPGGEGEAQLTLLPPRVIPAKCLSLSIQLSCWSLRVRANGGCSFTLWNLWGFYCCVFFFLKELLDNSLYSQAAH